MLKIITKYLVLIIVSLNLTLVAFAAVTKPQDFTGKTSTKLPARFVPEKVFLYVEITNPLSFFATSKATSPQQETLLESAFDLTTQERGELAQAKLALALLPKKKVVVDIEDSLEKNPPDQTFPFTIVGFFETPNPQVTSKMTSLVTESLNLLLGYANVKTEVNNLPKSIAAAESGAAVVLGLPSDLSEFLKEINSNQFNSLANSLDFQKIRQNTTNSSNVIVYINGVALREVLDSSNLSGNDRASYEVIAKILGLSGVKATGVNFSISGENPTRFSTIVDKNQSGIFPMFGSVALSDFHLAKLASDKTEVFFCLKIDPILIYKACLDAIFPGFSSNEQGFDPLANQMGINISQDIINNLTGELALSFSVSNTSELLIGKSNSPKLQLTGFLEIKNVETFSSAFAKLLQQIMKDPVETEKYKGFTVYKQQDVFWVYVENKMLVGTMEGIHQTLESIAEKRSLANVAAFQNNLAKINSNGLGLLYLNLVPFVRACPAPVKLLTGLALGNFPSQITVFGGRDKDELYVETSLTGFAAPIIIATVVGVAVTVPYLSRATAPPIINKTTEVPSTSPNAKSNAKSNTPTPKEQ